MNRETIQELAADVAAVVEGFLAQEQDTQVHKITVTYCPEVADAASDCEVEVVQTVKIIWHGGEQEPGDEAVNLHPWDDLGAEEAMRKEGSADEYPTIKRVNHDGLSDDVESERHTLPPDFAQQVQYTDAGRMPPRTLDDARLNAFNVQLQEVTGDLVKESEPDEYEQAVRMYEQSERGIQEQAMRDAEERAINADFVDGIEQARLRHQLPALTPHDRAMLLASANALIANKDKSDR